jgi:hypothetical protein
LAIYNQPEFTDEIKKAQLSDEEDTSLPYPEKFEYKPLPEKYLQQYEQDRKARLQGVQDRQNRMK